MTRPESASWRDFGDRVAARLAGSYWRAPFAFLVLPAGVLFLLYMLRGMRLVRLGVAAAAGAAAAALCFAHPLASLAGALFVTLSSLELFIPGPAWAFFLGLVLVRLVFDVSGGARLDWGVTAFRAALAVLLAVALTSALVLRHHDLMWREAHAILVGLGFYLAISRFADTPGRLVLLLWTAALAVAASAVLAALAGPRAGGLPWAMMLAVRFGAFGDPNVYAITAVCSVPLLFAVMSTWKGWRRWGQLPVMLLLIVSVILSQSRAGVLLLVALMVFQLLRAGRHGLGVVAGAAVILAIALQLVPEVYWARFRSIGQLGGIVVDQSLLLRQHALEIAWNVFLDHPWLGVGLGNLAAEVPHHALGRLLAHNSFLEVAASLGIVGLAAYVVLLWSALAMARRAAVRWRTLGRRPEQIVSQNTAIALLAFCAGAMTLSIQFYPLLWVLLGFANAARRCAESATAAAPPAVPALGWVRGDALPPRGPQGPWLPGAGRG